MKRQLLALGLMLGVLLGGLFPVSLSAQSSISIDRNNTSITFPSSIGFSITASSTSNITDIRLYYTVERKSFAQIYSEFVLDVTPALSVSASYSWDMRYTGGMPPGAKVNYWYRITNEDGDILISPIRTLVYNDTRFDWQSISEGMLEIYWYEGDQAFAEELMESAQAALVRLAADTGAELKDKVTLYIYANSSDLQSAMVFPAEWTGGVAYTDFNVIAIGIASYDIDWGKRAITHELAHKVTGQITSNPYGDLPVWLNEGISMYAEGNLEAVYVNYLIWAINQDKLISVQSLCSPFSANSADAYLSYAESFTLVNYLITNYGSEKFSDLLETFSHGAGYDEALLAVYGFDIQGLNTKWQAALKDGTIEIQPVRAIMLTPGLVVLFTIVGGGSIITAFWLWSSRVASRT
ncbi:MAG: peptidase MA family metallohydrolase [Dehalococcoides mccartyi]|uniref:peptidase MA family metallohydrolase n=1 Tax=Dehalococcoides mccartyi TaxID=61435 RepID=UPI0025C9D796|nr:peptidase MA family metallohydrolase [Dehalococcoides mccartyi]MDN4185846.1 peptidase MA family metallohydrolase [Dehalococcoides mccartyi]